MTSDEERLKEIADREQAATPGPWCWESVGDKCNKWCLGAALDENDRPVEGEIVEEFDEETETFKEKPIVIEFICESGDDGTFDDASFIAHAREDIPWLVQALKNVIQERDQWKAAADQWAADFEAEIDD